MIDTSTNISKVESWILASRPKTLLAAVVPVLIGTAIAIQDGAFNPAAAFIALLCSVFIQVGTNFVNDLYDFLSGTDKKDRVGPTRVLATGLISVQEMKIGIVLIFLTTFLMGLYLVYLGGWIILLIGILSIFSGIAYTAGPYPLAYNGLGDIFVFIFFGLVGTVGTHYVQALELSKLAIWASIPVGALITNILVVNNYRDADEDKQAGKNTLAVKFGKSFTRIQYLFFMILSYAILFVVYFTYKQSLTIFLPVLSLPMAVMLIKMIFTLKGRELNKTLELTAKLSAIYGVLFAVGLIL
ncbi:MAG: 1,4-dihydroxy-2-naphthoate polyprenyltransferase [Melioribacteraceae bacterium]|nr:1,4-dihydroxy-2-naphthoate polyprenyltransferase [Melioribacteraceae bacterium]MCF8354824.1 1,4-dihydroxy-2-naphthoate polyprenyltransferase [Melioribacteraceae bacterium]MCF8394545.1 1,4-dihydroxy-2-naphthoate polyprenyltransferase [Melioribacteraceae bacterium]MCF8420204.1 1,4-dihydroxy-2-naphthoate polyprenyltransferase [Melioribacteraceae bacterium]